MGKLLKRLKTIVLLMLMALPAFAGNTKLESESAQYSNSPVVSLQ